MNFHFQGRAVLNSSDATTSIHNHSFIGNTQEYIVCLYIRKMTLFVGDTSICV